MPSFLERARKAIHENQELFMLLEDLDRTGKLRKLKYKKRMNFTVEEDLARRFRAYCLKRHQEMSPIVENLIRAYLRQSNK